MSLYFYQAGERKHPLLYTRFDPTVHALQTPVPPRMAAGVSHICQPAVARNVSVSKCRVISANERFQVGWIPSQARSVIQDPLCSEYHYFGVVFAPSPKQVHLLSTSRDGSAGGRAGPCRNTSLQGTSSGGQQCPTEGTAGPCEPASGSRGAGCSSGNWFYSNA